MTETRSIDGGSVDFWSLSKAKVFRFPFCSAPAPFPISLALTGSRICLFAFEFCYFSHIASISVMADSAIAERLVLPFW